MGEHRPEIRSLTGLRFIAAISVVFAHFTGPFGIDDEKANGFFQYAGYKLFGAGDDAVQLFFVLSGFVLTYTYQLGDGMRGTASQFYVARIARIYPSYVIGFLLGAAPYFWSGPDVTRSAWTTGLLTLFLAQGFDREPLAWNGPAWSLSVEAVFYILFPLLLPLFAGQKVRTSFLAILICWVLTLTGFWLWRHGLIGYGAALQNPFLHLPEFLIGIAIAILFLNGTLNEVVKRVPCWAVVMAAIGGILLVGLLPREVRHNGLLAPIFGLVIWRLCFSSRISAALSVPALLLLGEASYALYITHYPVMQFVQRYLASAPVSVQFAIYVSCAVGISIAVFLVIERRARTLIRRALLNGHASIAKPSAPPTG